MDLFEAHQAMSYFEKREITLLVYSASMEQLSLLMSVVFGFLVVVYLAGKKITRTQAISLTAIYSGFVYFGTSG